MAGPTATNATKSTNAAPTPERVPDAGPGQTTGGPHSALLRLQRTAGNGAVSQLLQPAPGTGPEVPAAVQTVLASGGGQTLGAGIRAVIEPQFGWDFSQVRIHHSGEAAASARELGAAAYTIGTDIVFGAGRYAPDTDQGQMLLAHELAHVVQQSRGGSNSGPPAQAAHLEHAANIAARNSLDGAASWVGVEGASTVGLALQPDPPTFGNLPGEEPETRKRSLLVEEGGRWYTREPNGQRYTASGTYAFVVQRGKTWVVRPTGALGGPNPGHKDAAQGGRVEYAGLISFGSGRNTRGVLREWTNASGHFLPTQAFASAAGLPMDKFKPFTGPRPPSGPQAQLPVFQPKAPATIPPESPSGEPPSARTPTPAAPPAAQPPAAEASPPSARPAPQAPVADEPPQSARPAPQAPANEAAPQSTRPPPEAPPPAPRPPPGTRVPSRAVELPPEIDPAARGAAIHGGTILALEVLNAVLNSIGDSIQRSAAQSALYKEMPQITEALSNNPGQGVIVEFRFRRFTPHPDSVFRPGDMFESISWYPARSARDIQARLDPEEKGSTYSITRRWLQPTRPAPAQGAAGAKKPASTPAPVAETQPVTRIGSLEQWVQQTGAIYQKSRLRLYEALQAAHMGGMDGYRVELEGMHLLVDPTLYPNLLTAMQNIVAEEMNKRNEALRDLINREQARLDKFMKEGTIRKIWEQREIELDPHALDTARAHESSARIAIQQKRFRDARKSIKDGEDQHKAAWEQLYHYENGRPYFDPTK